MFKFLSLSSRKCTNMRNFVLMCRAAVEPAGGGITTVTLN